MCLWVILEMLVFSLVNLCSGEKLSFHTSFWDLLSLGRLSNPWRQGNLLTKQPGNSLQTNQLPGNRAWTNQPPRNSTWTYHCLLRTIYSNICCCCLANQNQRNKTYLKYLSTDFTCASSLMAYLTSTSKSMPLSGIHSAPNDCSTMSYPLWNEVRNKYISEYIILYIVVVLMLFYMNTYFFAFELSCFQAWLHIKII